MRHKFTLCSTATGLDRLPAARASPEKTTDKHKMVVSLVSKQAHDGGHQALRTVKSATGCRLTDSNSCCNIERAKNATSTTVSAENPGILRNPASCFPRHTLEQSVLGSGFASPRNLGVSGPHSSAHRRTQPVRIPRQICLLLRFQLLQSILEVVILLCQRSNFLAQPDQFLRG